MKITLTHVLAVLLSLLTACADFELKRIDPIQPSSSSSNAVLVPMETASAAKPPAAAPSAAAPAASNTTGLKAFAEVIKDAKSINGLLTLYQKDDKVWIALRPEQLGTPYFFQINSARGIGEDRFLPNWMLGSHLIEFRKQGTSIQMIAQNHRFKANAGTPLATAVKESFSDSLLGVASIVSSPDPVTKAILVEASALFISDVAAMSTNLENSFRLPYAFDARNSGFVAVRSSAELTTFDVSAHYGLSKVPAAPPPGSPSPAPRGPMNLEDKRSLFLGFYYSISQLPQSPMSARRADSRVGHFVSRVLDFSDDASAYARQYLIKRWRFEKRDPAAALSEPVKPITYWLDKNIPLAYRSAVTEGILVWNKAFERIGFVNAIRVQQQDENAEFDNNDSHHASVRWYLDTSEGALAIGPSVADPRTGEILDADISISDGWTRLPRRRAIEQLLSLAHGLTHQKSDPLGQTDADIAHALSEGRLEPLCNYESQALAELEFSIDLLMARGELEPDSPQVKALVLAQLRDTVAHEIGHTLGLTHNFKASTVYSLEQLDSPEFTAANGISGSVMEYNALNIAPKGVRQGTYTMDTLGPYDYWAIEYAYKPLERNQEKEELLKIAARSKEPLLAFSNDIDAGLGSVIGMDPLVNRRDLGDDPLAFAARRAQLSRELWDRLQSRVLKPGEQFDVLRRNFLSATAQMTLASEVAAKYVGGIVLLRDHADSGRAALQPIPAAVQRKALKLIANVIFSSDSFRFEPGFLARLVPDQFERGFGGESAGNLSAIVNPDPSLSAIVLNLQRSALDQLLADTVAARILDAPSKMLEPAKAFALSELYDTLQTSIWSELRNSGEIDPLRRNLQREYVRRLTNALTKPSATMPADARSLMRLNSRQLALDIHGALKKRYSKETKAHLYECADLLAEALKAPLQRTI